MLPHGLEPGTHLGAQFGNDEAVIKVIPARESGKLDRGAHGLETLDRLGSVLDGHPPVGLAVDHIQRQVPQGVQLDVSGRACYRNQRSAKKLRSLQVPTF